MLKSSKSDPALESREVSAPAHDEAPDVTATADDLDLRKTNVKAARPDVRFDEAFEFVVKEKHSYVNLLLWCRYTNRSDKMTKGSKLPDKDVLLGHVS